MTFFKKSYFLCGLLLLSLPLRADGERVTATLETHPGGTIRIDTLDKPSNTRFRITATAADGYSFKQWSDGETSSVREHEHTADFTADVAYYAIFTRDEHINRPLGSMDVSITNAGSLSAYPTYSLMATANTEVDANARFYIWNNGNTSGQGSVSSSILAYTETEGARYPYFVSNTGSLVLSFEQHPGGLISALHNSGLTYTLTATPNDGYSFKQWSNGTTSSSFSYTHDNNVQDAVLYAIFTRDEYLTRPLGSVDVSVTNPGSVSSYPTYSLTANANTSEDPNATFYSWNNGNTDGQNTASSSASAYSESDGARYPYFLSTTPSLILNLEQHPGGVVSASHNSDLTYTLTATPNEGYTFLQWADDATASATRSYTHNPAVQDAALYAVFTRNEHMNPMGGTISASVSNPGSVTTYPTYSLLATASASGPCASSFYLWSTGANTNPISYQENNGSCRAYFIPNQDMAHDDEASAGGSIEVTELSCGYTLRAIPVTEYSFAYWDDDHTNTNPVRDVDYAPGIYKAIFSMTAYKVGEEYYSTFAEAENAAVANSLPIQLVDDVAGNVNISQDIQIDGNSYILNDLTILNGSKLTLANDLNVNNLYLQTTTASSSQLVLGGHDLNYTNAYIDITLEASHAEASPDKWYAFSVPFEVDVESGIRRANAPEAACTSMTDYLVWVYDGDRRADTGNGWVKMSGGTLYPGKFYMIGIDGTQNTWRFAKKSGSALGGSNVVDLPAFTGSIIDGGWNAIGNGTLQYATASIPDIAFVQVYDNNMSTYLPKMLNATSFVVACPFFAQVEGANTMTLSASNETNHDALYAPRRMAMQEKNIYEVRLSKDDYYDVLFISANEESSETYQIGKDLLKFGLNTSRPQVFTMNAGTMLCVEDRPFVNGAADFPIYILAPQAGDYELTVSDGNRSVYLLENGLPIADITGSTYTLCLSRGMVNSYSLRIGEKHDVYTGIDEQEMDADAQKIIYNNQLYIIRNQQIYDATGARVR